LNECPAAPLTHSLTDFPSLACRLYPEHYFLELKPDLDTLTFDGEMKVDVEVRTATAEVTLNSKELVVKSASFGAAKLVEISYHLVNTTVTLRFDQELPLGKGTLNISYSGILNGDMAGFYKSGYVDADGKPQVMANTQFEALDARRAFPCWDEPAVKALFSVTLVVDAKLTALSNMPELSVTHVAGGLKRVVFDVTPKMSTYLLAWAVGSFDYVQGSTKNGVLVRVFSPPGRATQGAFALEVGKRALDFYDDYFKVLLNSCWCV
jgi:aminopeptidase N